MPGLNQVIYTMLTHISTLSSHINTAVAEAEAEVEAEEDVAEVALLQTGIPIPTTTHRSPSTATTTKATTSTTSTSTLMPTALDTSLPLPLYPNLENFLLAGSTKIQRVTNTVLLPPPTSSSGWKRASFPPVFLLGVFKVVFPLVIGLH